MRPGAGGRSAEAPRTASTPQAPVTSLIRQLGDLDYGVRTKAAQALRRAPAGTVVPALLEAIERNDDQYVRYKALVLLTGLAPPGLAERVWQATFDPNDRLRFVAYRWFEIHPDPSRSRGWVQALDREQADLVRPALLRALLASGPDAAARRLILGELERGGDGYRSAIVDALGDHKAVWALDALLAILQKDGPLKDDAAVAVGQIGDRRALPVLASQQRSAPREAQPAIATGICLLGQNCEAHRGFLARTLTFAEDTPGFQPLLRAAASGLGEIAATGDRDAADALFDVGVPASDPARAPIALAVAALAMRNPAFFLDVFSARPDRAGALALAAEGFDMLEEDDAEERFYVAMRKAHWAAREGTSLRESTRQLIGRLEF